MPSIDFEFRARGAAAVRRDLDSIRASAQRTGQAVAALSQGETRVLLNEIGKRQRARSKEAGDARANEARITSAAKDGARDRTRASEGEADARAKAYAGIVKSTETTERQRTRIVERELRERERAERNAARRTVQEMNMRARDAERAQANLGQRRAAWGATGARVAQQAVGAAIGFAGNMHGQIQDARMQRARAGTGLTDIFRGAGGDAAEMQQWRTRFQREALALGMRYEDLVSDAAAVQTESSFFSRTQSQEAAGLSEQQARAANLESFFRQARTGRDVVGQAGVGQYVRIGGILKELGVDSATTELTQQSLARLGEMGAIELSSISREGMQPIMSRVGQSLGALGPGATAEQRSQAVTQTITRAMAEMEVMRGVAGYNPRNAGQILSSIQPALQNPIVQERLLSNIRSFGGMSREQRRAVENQLFEDDPTRRGQRRLRAGLTDPVGFAVAAGTALRDNPTLLRNMFSGGGPGNPQGLQANWRNLMAGMFTVGDGGETGYQKILRFTREAQGGFSTEELRRRHGLAEADPLTELNRQEEARLSALTENTGAMGRLSNTFAAWAARNPLAATALGMGGGTAASLVAGLGGNVGGRVVGALGSGALGLAGRGALGALSGVGATGLAGTLAGGVGAASGGAIAATVAGGLALGIGAGELLNRTTGIQNALAGTGRNADGSSQDNSTLSILDTGVLREFGGIIADAFRSNPPVVQISPQAAAQAAGVARTQAAADRNKT